MAITLEEAKNLQYRDVLVTAQGYRWRVNGAVQRWKRSPDRIRVPLKRGLYEYGAITDADFTNNVCDYLTKEHDV